MILPAISVRQPWAAALLYLGKNVENRSWPLPPKYVNKPLLLHAGKAKPRPSEWSGLMFERAMQASPMLYGGIIGEIVFGPSAQTSQSEWAEPGCWHWPCGHGEICRVLAVPGDVGNFHGGLQYQDT